MRYPEHKHDDGRRWCVVDTFADPPNDVRSIHNDSGSAHRRALQLKDIRDPKRYRVEARDVSDSL